MDLKPTRNLSYLTLAWAVNSDSLLSRTESAWSSISRRTFSSILVQSQFACLITASRIQVLVSLMHQFHTRWVVVPIKRIGEPKETEEYDAHRI